MPVVGSADSVVDEVNHLTPRSIVQTGFWNDVQARQGYRGPHAKIGLEYHLFRLEMTLDYAR